MTHDEWVEWKNLELTQKVFEALKEEQEVQKQNWADGQFPNQRINDIQVGFVQGIDFVLKGEFIKEEANEERVGDTSG